MYSIEIRNNANIIQALDFHCHFTTIQCTQKDALLLLLGEDAMTWSAALYHDGRRIHAQAQHLGHAGGHIVSVCLQWVRRLLRSLTAMSLAPVGGGQGRPSRHTDHRVASEGNDPCWYTPAGLEAGTLVR